MGYTKLQVMYWQDGRRELKKVYVPGPGENACGSEERVRFLRDDEPDPISGLPYRKPDPPPAPRSTDPGVLVRLQNLTVEEAQILKTGRGGIDDVLRASGIDGL